jgi:GDP-L-fucose synthase
VIEKESKIFIAGRGGMVGSAIERELNRLGYKNIVGLGSKDLDLRNQKQVDIYFNDELPDYVFLAAAKVGGIQANIDFPADFLYDNLLIESNVIQCCYKYKVKKLVFLASSCVYPRLSIQPMKEEYLLDGKLEPTNEGYAIAKIAGMKLCEMFNRQYNTNFISVMPSNIYGIGDNFDKNKSHVVAALIRKFHDAKINNQESVEIWGSGNAKRELLFSEDFAKACVFLFEQYEGTDFVNIGTGIDISIKELANLISSIVGFKGTITFNLNKPDGMPQKVLDVSRINNLGWHSTTPINEGISLTYEWYKKHISND